MKRMAFFGALLALASVVALGGAVGAQENGRDRRGPSPGGARQDVPRAVSEARPGGEAPPPARPRGPGDELRAPAPEELERLALTDAQRVRLEALRDEEERASIRAEADARIAELDLRRLVRSDNPDLREIDAQVDKIAGLRAGITKARVALVLGVRSMLTAEQRTKLREHRGPAEGCGAAARPAPASEDRPDR